MKTFQQDYTAAQRGSKTEVLRRRKARIAELTEALKASRGYTRRCLADRIALLQEEYEDIKSIGGAQG